MVLAHGVSGTIEKLKDGLSLVGRLLDVPKRVILL
jgi:hypothetical protein